LARMCMTRHAFSSRDSQIEEAICASRIFAREKDGTKCDVEVITLRLWLILDCWNDIEGGYNVRHELTPFLVVRLTRIFVIRTSLRRKLGGVRWKWFRIQGQLVRNLIRS